MKHTKRIAAFALSACMAVSLVPTSFAADATQSVSKNVNADVIDIVQEGICGENLTWTLDTEGTLTISGMGSLDADNWSDGAPWYALQNQIKQIVIGKGVESIGYEVFCNYEDLTTVTIAASVRNIDSRAFEGCRNLKNITLLDGLKSIGNYAFYGCSSLTSVAIPDSVTSIGLEAFSGCSSLTDITIGDSVTEIGESAFKNTPWWEKQKETQGEFIRLDHILLSYQGTDQHIVIPDDIVSIADGAFAYCNNLTSVMIPDCVTSIGCNAFSNCDHLTSVMIGDGVKNIGRSAFSGCSRLENLTIGNSVMNMGESVFYECSSLKNVTIPNSVSSISKYAFYHCSSLTDVTIGNGVTSIEDAAFYGCEGLTSLAIPDCVTMIGDEAFTYCTNLKNVTIGNGVRSIGKAAFARCNGLTRLTIPESVKAIDRSAFFCTGLTTIRFEGDAPEMEDGYGIFTMNTVGDLGTVTATAYYPAGNGTWTKQVMEACGGNITWAAYDGISSIFTDVPANAWYTLHIQYVYNNNLMSGTSKTTFGPNLTLTRAQVAQILYNKEGKPAVAGSVPFEDVKSGTWYYDAVRWAYQQGVVAGTSAAAFEPNENITREAMAVILHNYEHKPATSGNFDKFEDGSKVSGWAKNGMLWATQQGIINGSVSGGKTYMNPRGNATRAEAAAIFRNYLEK